MNHDIIRRADLERELLKEYSQVVSNRAKHPEEMGYSWQVEELDKILKIAKKIPGASVQARGYSQNGEDGIHDNGKCRKGHKSAKEQGIKKTGRIVTVEKPHT